MARNPEDDIRVIKYLASLERKRILQKQRFDNRSAEQIEQRRIYQRQWAQANKERAHAWAEANKLRRREQRRIWLSEHPDKVEAYKQYAREHYREIRELALGIAAAPSAAVSSPASALVVPPSALVDTSDDSADVAESSDDSAAVAESSDDSAVVAEPSDGRDVLKIAPSAVVQSSDDSDSSPELSFRDVFEGSFVITHDNADWVPTPAISAVLEAAGLPSSSVSISRSLKELGLSKDFNTRKPSAGVDGKRPYGWSGVRAL